MNTLILLLATAGVYTAQLDQLYNDDLVVTNVDMASKQDKLIAGENITIDANNVISATGGGGGGGGGGINTNGVRSLIDASFVGGTNSVNTAVGEYLPRITDSDGNKTAVTIGTRNGTVGKASLANGNSVEASGTYSHAEGFFTKAQGQTAHAEGVMSKATANYSHAEGNGTTASGLGSHTEGLATTASGNFAFAAGYGASATGQTSFVWQGMGADETVIDESTIANLTNESGRAANNYTDHGAGTFNINPAGGADGFYIGSDSLTELIESSSLTNKGAVADAASKYLEVTKSDIGSGYIRYTVDPIVNFKSGIHIGYHPIWAGNEWGMLCVNTNDSYQSQSLPEYITEVALTKNISVFTNDSQFAKNFTSNFTTTDFPKNIQTNISIDGSIGKVLDWYQNGYLHHWGVDYANHSEYAQNSTYSTWTQFLGDNRYGSTYLMYFDYQTILKNKILMPIKIGNRIVDTNATVSMLANYVPTSRTINNKPLSSNISLTASDVHALSEDTEIPSIDGLASKTYVDNANSNTLAVVNSWENFLDGSNVVFSITNYLSDAYVLSEAKLKILELKTNEYHEVYNSRDEILLHLGNFETNKLIAATNALVNGPIAAVNTKVDGKADKAWGKYTSTGTAINTIGYSNTVYITEPTTVFAGGMEYTRFAVGEGSICILTTKGAPAYTTGDEGTFKFQDNGGTNYFGFAKTDSYSIGAEASGISVANNIVTITYNVTMSGVPCVWYMEDLEDYDPTQWEQLNLSDGTAVPGASHVVSWEQNPQEGTRVCYINCPDASGFFRATIEAAGSAKFVTNMPADLMRGIVCTNTATGVNGIVKPSYNGSTVIWTWSSL